MFNFKNQSYRVFGAGYFFALGFASVDIFLVFAIVNALLIELVLNRLGIAAVQPAGVNVSRSTWLFALDADYFLLDIIGEVKVVEGLGFS